MNGISDSALIHITLHTRSYKVLKDLLDNYNILHTNQNTVNVRNTFQKGALRNPIWLFYGAY